MNTSSFLAVLMRISGAAQEVLGSYIKPSAQDISPLQYEKKFNLNVNNVADEDDNLDVARPMSCLMRTVKWVLVRCSTSDESEEAGQDGDAAEMCAESARSLSAREEADMPICIVTGGLARAPHPAP
eukprot:CAMPEP_0184394538 /NCGR_PEP_ID=MMETSP0007-20130409/39844_1 /TAXON_ID=97485 /ORGANISM="Prymnesium parvum, Strain Texoma1" /LENGTH=126 /DNA_ID=CAMNT_0026746137 /DNA_START=67 /DNA_END=448 /DNA_ORIENTATION=+